MKKTITLLCLLFSVTLLYSQTLTVNTSGVTSSSNWTVSGNTITVTSDVTMHPSVLEGYLNAGTSITVNTSIIKIESSIAKTSGGNARITLQANANLQVLNGAGISSSSNQLDIILWANADSSAAYSAVNDFLYLDPGTSLASNGGLIVLAGGADNGQNGGTANDGIPDNYPISGQTATIYAGLNIGPISGTSTSITINSSGGDIILRGQSGSNTSLPGISSQANFSIDAGTGQIVMDGTTTTGHGIELTYGAAPNIAITSASTATPAIQITGSTSNTGYFGLWASNNLTGNILIQSTANTGGGVTISGTGSGNGLLLGTQNASCTQTIQLLSQNGDINLIGQNGAGLTTHVLRLEGETYIGNRKNSTAVNGITPSVTASSANVSLQGDYLNFTSNTSLNNHVSTTGKLDISSYSASFGSTFTWNGSISGSDFIGSSSVSRLKILNYANLSIFSLGKTSNTSSIQIDGPLSVGGAINLYGGVVGVNANITSSNTGNIFIQASSSTNPGIHINTGQILKTGGDRSTLTLKSNNRLTVSNNITATNTALDVVLWSDYSNNVHGGVTLGQTIVTNGGHVWIGGSSTANGSLTWNGLTVGDGPSEAGSAYNWNAIGWGNTSINSSGGDVFVWAGDGYSAGGGEDGIYIDNASSIPSITAGTGTVSLITDIIHGTGLYSLEISSAKNLNLAPTAGSYNTTGMTAANTLTLSHNSAADANFTGDLNYLLINDFDSLENVNIGAYAGTGLPGDSTFNITNSSNITLNSHIKPKGNISLTGANIAINAELNSRLDSTVHINSTGAVTEGGSGKIIAGELNLQGSANYTLTALTNDVNTIYAGEEGSPVSLLYYNNADGLAIGSTTSSDIYTTSNILIKTASGDIDVNTNISTTSNDHDAVKLMADYDASAGSIGDGHIRINNHVLIGTGEFGIVKLYSGSPDLSLGLNDLIGISNVQYGVDQNTNSFNPTLVAGDAFALYRTAGSGAGNMLSFNGTDNYITVPDHSSLDITSNITVEAWIKCDNLTNQIIVGKTANSGAIAGIAYLLRVRDSGLVFNVNDGTDINVSSPSYALNTDKWYHVVGYRNGSTNKIGLYVNGEWIGENNSITGNISTNNEALFIGKYIATWGQYFSGEMDEIRIWNDIRTPQEIREFMMRSLPSPSTESNLAAYYKIDENGGGTLADASSNTNDGSLYNMSNTNWLKSDCFNKWLGFNATWSDASNWSLNTVPDTTNNVGIYDDATLLPSLSGSSAENIVIGQNCAISLAGNMNLNGNLILESDLNLNGRSISLGNNSMLIEDLGSITGMAGQISVAKNITAAITSENIGGLGAEITTSSTLGQTEIIRYQNASTGSISSIGRKYGIHPTNNSALNATLVFHYSDDELNGLTESTLALLRSTTEGASWTLENGTVNTTDNTITKTAVSQFSDWTAGGSSIFELTNLTTTTGTLSPAFSTDIKEYTVSLSSAPSSINFTPTVSTGGTLIVDTAAHTSGTSFTANVTNLTSKRYAIKVMDGSEVKTVYSITFCVEESAVSSPTEEWIDFMYGDMWDPNDDQQATAETDLVGDSLNPMLQAQQSYRNIDGSLEKLYFFRYRLGNKLTPNTSAYFGVDLDNDLAIDMVVEANVKANTPYVAFHVADPNKDGTSPSQTGWLNSTNNTAIEMELSSAQSFISSYAVTVDSIHTFDDDLDDGFSSGGSNGTDTWVEFAFTDSAMQEFTANANYIQSTFSGSDATGIVYFTSTSQTANGDVGGVNDDTADLTKTWVQLGNYVTTSFNTSTNGTTLPPLTNIESSYSLNGDGSIYGTWNILDNPDGNITVTVNGQTFYYDAADTTNNIGEIYAFANSWYINVSDFSSGSYEVSATMDDGEGQLGLGTGTFIVTDIYVSDTITSSPTPTVTGFYTENTDDEIEIIVLDSNGTQVYIDTITAAADSTWSLAIADSLDAGTYSVTATVNTVVGNSTSTARHTGTLIITPQPPAITIDTSSANSATTGGFVTITGSSNFAELDGTRTIEVELLDNNGDTMVISTPLALDSNAGTWSISFSGLQGLASYTINATHTLDSINAQDAYTFTTSAAVPVDLLYFEAKLKEDNNVYLSWATASELNNHEFVIWRSEDGSEWHALGSVAGQGNSSTIIDYEYVDQFPRTKNYYKLQQKDFDGVSEFYGMEYIELQNDKSIVLYPNPAQNIVYLKTDLLEHSTQLDIYTVDGTLMISKNIETNVTAIDISSLTAGLYFVKVNNAAYRIIKN